MHHQSNNVRIIPGICEICGKSFLGFRSSQARFCSKSCARRAYHGTLADRFALRINHDGPLPVEHPEFGNCWLWTGAHATDGYGRSTGNRSAHQIAWEIASGASIPAGLIVLHTCDVRGCVRNDDVGVYVVRENTLPRFGHLALGTYRDNMIDASDKGHSRAGALRRYHGSSYQLLTDRDETI